MILTRFALPLLALVFLAGCASTGTAPPLAHSDTPWGDYLAGRHAANDHDMELATRYFRAAMAKDAGNAQLRSRAMLSAVAAGNMREAGQLAQMVFTADPNNNLAPVFVVTDLMARHKYAQAMQVIDAAHASPLNQLTLSLLRGWVLAAEGKGASSRSQFDELASEQLLPELGPLSAGLLLWQEGDKAAAEAALRKAYGTNVLPNRTLLALGALLVDTGQADKAAELAKAHLARDPNEVEALQVLHWANTGSSPGNPFATPNAAAAEGLRAMAQLFATRGIVDFGVWYGQAAKDLDPNNTATTVLLAQVLEAQGRQDDAMHMFATVRSDDPWYETAQLQTSRVYLREKQNQKAIAVLEQLDATNPSLRVKTVLAQTLQFDRQYAKAHDLYDQLINDDPDHANWSLYFNRGVTLERTGRWKQAVPDFRKSLELKPDQPDVLNYLGYTFVDHGENVDEGFALIQKAIELDPEAGFIVDSLGWGHYRLGEYAKAVQELERAVEMEPGEPAINDHLGDALWQVGRKREARFQWERVLSLDPGPDEDVDIVAIKNKIKNGLPPRPTTHEVPATAGQPDT